jgi:hypothetical protein
VAYPLQLQIGVRGVGNNNIFLFYQSVVYFPIIKGEWWGMAAQPTNQIFKTQILMGPVELVFHITHTHPHLNAVTCRTIMPIIVPTCQQVNVTPPPPTTTTKLITLVQCYMTAAWQYEYGHGPLIKITILLNMQQILLVM